MTQQAYRKLNLKRKNFSKGKNQKFKRFKKTPKYIKDNVENQVAREKEREKDIFDFSDSDDGADDLGMGLEISDLPFLADTPSGRDKELIALSQDSVKPFFSNESDYDKSKLDEALAELRYSNFRPNQEETIKRILFGRSTLFISPTGSGKSLCYQLPALLYWRYRKYITIVVSPLISLMQDQMANFPSSLKAVSLHFGQSRQEKMNIIRQLTHQEAQVIFVSPEAIVGGVLELDDLKNFPPVGFVCIDEAHCLSEWSHNFRPAYLQFFRILSENLSIKTFLGLTATASRASTFAISRCLTINPESDVIGTTTVPENLILSVSHERNKERALVALLKSPTFLRLESIIVYCNRRDETENVASIIRTAMQNHSSIIEVPERVKRGANKNECDSSPEKKQMKLPWNAEAYHAGLSSECRKRIQKQFIKGETRVVVATIAFGMGINKANVRAIIHYDMPSSFESYVQEIGRAGRDGRPAQCHMFLRSDKTDVFYQQRNIYASVVEQRNIAKLVDYLFVPCRCTSSAAQDTRVKLEKLNQNDAHVVSSWQKTDFTNTQVQVSDEDLDDEDQLIADNSCRKGEHEDKPVKFIHKSIVNKHRACTGHEVSFSIEEASQEINLSPESIITFICQIQQAYPQLKIKQFAPLKSKCNFYCYRGPNQMEAIAASCQAVALPLSRLRMKHKEKSNTPFEIPNKISFEITYVARQLGKPTSDIIKILKKNEWELVEKTGRFRRSQARVTFEGNSFHIFTVSDLSVQEKDEIIKFLVDYMQKNETMQRNKISRMYNVFKSHNIDVEQMTDKIVRLQTSFKLKSALNLYFNPSTDEYIADEAISHLESDGCEDDLEPAKLRCIKESAREFISANGMQHLPRAIARIFQGISCPNYPAEVWGLNRKWWRLHPDVDFLKLQKIIKNVWVETTGSEVKY